MRVLRLIARVFAFGVGLCVFLWPTLIALFLVGMHLDEIHTTSTAMDPIPGLSGVQVLGNIFKYSLPCAIGVTLVAALIYGILHGLLENDEAKTRKRWSLSVALIYWILSFGLLVANGVDCYQKYVATG